MQELLEYCRQHKPSKLVLMGPFVDEEHPKVASGLLDMTFEELFVSQVKDQIEEMLQAEGSGMHVVLLPSQRCVQHHPVFPQPPLEVRGEGRMPWLPPLVCLLAFAAIRMGLPDELSDGFQHYRKTPSSLPAPFGASRTRRPGPSGTRSTAQRRRTFCAT